MRKFLVILCLLLFGKLFAQVQFDTIPYLENLKHIRKSAHIIFDSLQFKLIPEFYTIGINDSGQYIYLYVSTKDSIKRASPGRFYYYDFDLKRAQEKSDSLEKLGFETMIYKTSGTSGCALTRHMLEYDKISISFLLLHEAMHLELGQFGYHVTYDFEESIGDVVGNIFLFSLIDKKNKCAAKRFVRVNEKVFKSINRCLDHKISTEKCERKIFRIVKRKGTQFQKERYFYKVNNAYLVRFHDYAKHYFQLKSNYKKGMNMPSLLKACFGISDFEKVHLEK